MKRTPYIEVVGVTSKTQCEQLFEAHTGSRLLGIGVKLDNDSLGISTIRAPRCVRLSQVAQIFLDDPAILNVIHFSTRSPNMIARDIHRIFDLAGPAVGGIQIQLSDITLATQLESVINGVSLGMRIIWECTVHYDRNVLVARLDRFRQNVTDIVISDAQVPYDSSALFRANAFAQYVHKEIPDLGLGFRGGITAENLIKWRPLFTSLQGVNISAERGLLNQNGALDMTKATAYLKRANELI